MMKKQTFVLFVLLGALVACTSATQTTQPAPSQSPVVSPEPGQTLAVCLQADFPAAQSFADNLPQIETINAIRTLFSLPGLPLEFIEMTTMINSPNMDLAVALYQDAEGRKYFVEPCSNQVVEIDARVALSSISSDAVPLSQEALRAKAEELIRGVIIDFDSMQATLSYEEGVKGDYFFFNWRATGFTGFMNKPFVQIGLHKSGELFAYYNTLDQVALP